MVLWSPQSRARKRSSPVVAPPAGAPGEDGVFQIGSITNVFTALALADAVTRRELALRTPLSTYFPEAGSARTSTITLGHLATHISSLPRMPQGFLRKALRSRSDPYRNFDTEDRQAALANCTWMCWCPVTFSLKRGI